MTQLREKYHTNCKFNLAYLHKCDSANGNVCVHKTYTEVSEGNHLADEVAIKNDLMLPTMFQCRSLWRSNKVKRDWR